MGLSKWSWGSARSKPSKRSLKKPTVPPRVEPVAFKDWTTQEEELVEAMKHYSISSASSRSPRSKEETAEFINPVGPKSERVVYDQSVLDVGIGTDRRRENMRRVMEGTEKGGFEAGVEIRRRNSLWGGFVQDMKMLWREKTMYSLRVLH